MTARVGREGSHLRQVATREVLRRRELGAFLRTRRERLQPEQVGLEVTGRRRTPGLRRQEVADLAHVGLAWYTWLEQSRPINVSEGVLDALAEALRLSRDEHAYLRCLAHSQRGPYGNGEEWAGDVALPRRSLLTALDPHPAYIRDANWNATAWNATFEAMTALSTSRVTRSNLMLYLFNDLRARELHVDWDATASFAVASFRFECGARLGEPAVGRLVAELMANIEFADRWRRQEVTSARESVVTWAHPSGPLQYARVLHVLPSASDPLMREMRGDRLVVHVPQRGGPTERTVSFSNGAARQQHARLPQIEAPTSRC